LNTELYGTLSPLAGFRAQMNQKSCQMEQYYVEAEKSLTTLQQSLKWSPNLSRDISLKLQIHKIPKIRKLTEDLYSYVGKRIIRRNPNSPDSFWDIEEYRFCL
jgi:hypothetical protein